MPRVAYSLQIHTLLAMMAAADGLARPVKVVLSPLVLKRARRNAAQAMYTKANTQPKRPRLESAQKNATSAGATPNATMSERLSYSAPNSLSERVQRATRPSKVSRMNAA